MSRRNRNRKPVPSEAARSAGGGRDLHEAEGGEASRGGHGDGDDRGDRSQASHQQREEGGCGRGVGVGRSLCLCELLERFNGSSMRICVCFLVCSNVCYCWFLDAPGLYRLSSVLDYSFCSAHCLR